MLARHHQDDIPDLELKFVLPNLTYFWETKQAIPTPISTSQEFPLQNSKRFWLLIN